MASGSKAGREPAGIGRGKEGLISRSGLAEKSHHKLLLQGREKGLHDAGDIGRIHTDTAQGRKERGGGVSSFRRGYSSGCGEKGSAGEA